jgi:hypothetical protein
MLETGRKFSITDDFMFVKINYLDGWGTFDSDKVGEVGVKPVVSKFGIQLATYEVIDEKLFFLSVIKHGIIYKLIQDE